MPPLESSRPVKWLVLLASLLVLQPGRGFEGDLTFTGRLERVGDQSISVKLADRTVIDAMLSNTPALGRTGDRGQIQHGRRGGNQMQTNPAGLGRGHIEVPVAGSRSRFDFCDGRRRRK